MESSSDSVSKDSDDDEDHHNMKDVKKKYHLDKKGRKGSAKKIEEPSSDNSVGNFTFNNKDDDGLMNKSQDDTKRS